MQHRCQSLVITCMDFRLHQAVREFLLSRNLENKYDLVALAGATKDLVDHDTAGTTILMKEIEISHTLHGVNHIMLIHHTDCGAYGGHDAFDDIDAEQDKQLGDMRVARSLIQEQYPGLEVELVLARLSGTDEKPQIDFAISA